MTHRYNRCNIILQGEVDKVSFKDNIGPKIKTIREEKGLSQGELVEKLIENDINMSRETLSKIENNNRTISAIELNVICYVLGVNIDAFFGENEADDDLTKLFRKKGSFNDKTIKEIESLEEMIKIFISQERIYKGEFKPQKKRPLWEECLN